MKILHIMNWFMEGMGYQENYLPFYQAGFGNEVRILCSKHYLKKRKPIKGSNKDITYYDRSLKIKRLKSLYIQFPTEQNWYLGLKKEIEDFKPEVIHLHNIRVLPTWQLLATNFANKDRVKIFVDSHIDNGNFDLKKFHKFIYFFGFIKKLIIPMMLRRNFVFLPVNPYSRYCLNSYFGIPQEKMQLLPLGVDNEKIFFSRQEREKIRKKYAIGKEDIVFVFSGVFEKSKSLADLINAFKILTKKYKHIFLLMIGEGRFAQDESFGQLKDSGRVILPGWQPMSDFYKWYSMADIGIMPGKLGGVKDILGAARPLIISDDLAVSYLLEYNNGLKFRRGDVDGLAHSMEKYIKSPDLIQKHGERSLQLVNEKLAWQNIANQSLRIYSE